jgi:hypothetical protein
LDFWLKYLDDIVIIIAFEGPTWTSMK